MKEARPGVVMLEYDPRWPEEYLEEEGHIRGAMGASLVAVEHIGSTAVPRLAAKPIIDILAGVRRLIDAEGCIDALQGIGYEYVPEYEADLPDRRYFRKGSAGARTHHLHVVEHGGAFWRDHVLFRDYLRAHPERARQYEELKRDLAKRLGRDKHAYTDAKASFVRGVLAEARRRGQASRRTTEPDTARCTKCSAATVGKGVLDSLVDPP